MVKARKSGIQSKEDHQSLWWAWAASAVRSRETTGGWTRFSAEMRSSSFKEGSSINLRLRVCRLLFFHPPPLAARALPTRCHPC